MQFINDWYSFLKECKFDSKKEEILKKRNEIQDKIAKIELELATQNKKEDNLDIDVKSIDVEKSIPVQELELALESLKLELKKLKMI